MHVFLIGLLLVIFLPRVETSTVATLRAQPGKSLLAGFVLLVTTPVAAVLLIISILGLPIGLALGALYAMALVGGLVVTAFFIGDAEVRWLAPRPMVSPSQHALLLLAGVVTLAVLRSLLGGVIVLASVLFGVGALMLSGVSGVLTSIAVNGSLVLNEAMTMREERTTLFKRHRRSAHVHRKARPSLRACARPRRARQDAAVAGQDRAQGTWHTPSARRWVASDLQ